MSARLVRPGLSPLGDFLADGLLSLERDTGEELFTWKLKEIPCTANTFARGTRVDLNAGGFGAEILFTLIIRREEFIAADSTIITADSELYTADDDTPIPVAGRTLIFRGRTMRILTAKEGSGRGHFSLDLGDNNE